MGPDPQEQPAANVDLADALHARTHAGWRAIEMRLNAEVIAAFTRYGYRSHLAHCEWQRLGRKGRQHQVPALPSHDHGNITLINLQNDPIGIQRRHLE